MKYVAWLLKAVIFFTLFAFALNNQQEVTVHFFFGTQWIAPLVMVVLAAFSAGLVVGVLIMVPRWWGQRSAARKLSQQQAVVEDAVAGTLPAADTSLANHTAPNTHGI